MTSAIRGSSVYAQECVAADEVRQPEVWADRIARLRERLEQQLEASGRRRIDHHEVVGTAYVELASVSAEPDGRFAASYRPCPPERAALAMLTVRWSLEPLAS